MVTPMPEREQTEMIEIVLNGAPQVVRPTSLEALCTHRFAHVSACATAVNGEFVARGQRSARVLRAGDHVEVVVPQSGG